MWQRRMKVWHNILQICTIPSSFYFILLLAKPQYATFITFSIKEEVTDTFVFMSLVPNCHQI